MASRDAVRFLAIGRIVLGVAMLLLPRRTAAAWVGADADTAGASVLGRALGVRDAVFGGMLLHTLAQPQVAQRWTATCGVCDTVDGLAALAVRDQLPTARGRLGGLFALGSGLAHLGLSRQLVSSSSSSSSDLSPPAPASSPETVMPDGADEAKRAMGARTIGVDTPGHGSGATTGDPSQPGGLTQ